MSARSLILALLAAAIGTGCVENRAPGNDREAGLDPAPAPAPVEEAATAISGVATALLLPEIMTDADQRNAPSVADRCRFRMTAVDFPVLVYGSSAIVKLNGKLVALPAAGEGRYADAGVEVSVRPLEEEDTSDGGFSAEFILRLPGAPNELGFHGYADCGT